MLDGLVVVLPIVGAVTAVVGLLVARRRSWARGRRGAGACSPAVALVWVAAEVGRDRAAEEFTGGILGPAAVDAVADHVVASLDSALLVVTGRRARRRGHRRRALPSPPAVARPDP